MKNLSAIVCLLLVLMFTTGAWRTAAGEEPDILPPKDFKLAKGQTIEDVAEKYFGSPAVADEIRALNEVEQGKQPEAGAKLKLPGKEREQAVMALKVARQAFVRAEADDAGEYAPERFASAQKSLDRAQEALKAAKYDKCRKIADETWALARMARKESLARRPKKNRFAVSIDDKGLTRVEVMDGDGVKVTAGKKSTTVKEGHAVRVKPGQPPEKAQPLLSHPVPMLPNDDSVLVTHSIFFNWKSVEGAARYVLLIAEDPRGLRAVRQMTTEKTSYLFRSSLPDGRYFWFLRTVDARGLVGHASSPRRFTLETSSDGGLSVETVDSESRDGGK